MQKKLFVLIIALTSLIHPSSQAQEILQAGIASTNITLDNDIPLGGYGTGKRRHWSFKWRRAPKIRLFRTNAGQPIDPIRAKAMVLKKQGRKLLFLSLDIVAVPSELYEALSKKLVPRGFDPNGIFVSGTHTHSGPGGLSKNRFWQIFAMDRFISHFYHSFIDEIMETVAEAEYSLTSARLLTNSYQSHGLQRNRRGGDRPLDPTVNTLFAQTLDGRWLGGIVNFAVHGVSLDENNMNFSSDTPGSIERESEKVLTTQNQMLAHFPDVTDTPTVLFINSAEGDIHPTHFHLDGIKQMGEEFAEQLSTAWKGNHLLSNDDWTITPATISMGKPKMNYRNCIEKEWIPRRITLFVNRFFGSSAKIWQIKLGDLLMMTWPGEATTELGLQLKEMAKNKGVQSAWVLGLTNDHLAYFTTPQEYDHGGYETCVNLFGKDGGKKIVDAHTQLLK